MPYIGEIEEHVSRLAPDYTNVHVYPRGAPRYVDAALKGSARFASKFGNFLPNYRADNLAELTADALIGDTQIVADRILAGLEINSLLKIEPSRELVEVFDFDSDGTIQLTEELIAPHSAGDGLLLYAVRTQVISSVDSNGTAPFGSIIALPKVSLSDGDYFILDDGLFPPVTYHFNVTGGYTPSGGYDSTNIEVDLSTSASAIEVADTIRDALNGSYAAGSITALAQASLTDGDYFMLGDGTTLVTFYINKTGLFLPTDGYSATKIELNINAVTTAAEVADVIRTAVATTALEISADATGLALIAFTSTFRGSAANVAITEALTAGTFTPTGMAGGNGTDDLRITPDVAGSSLVSLTNSLTGTSGNIAIVESLASGTLTPVGMTGGSDAQIVRIRSNFRVFTGDVLAIKTLDEHLQSVVEYAVTEATYLGTSGVPGDTHPYNTEVTLDKPLSRSLTTDEWIHIRAYPAYLSDTVFFPLDRVGPVLLDYVSGRMKEHDGEIDEFLNMQTFDSSDNALSGDQLTHVEKNHPITNLTIPSNVMSLWELFRGSLQFTGSKTRCICDSDGKFVLSAPLVPSFPAGQEWKIRVIASGPILLRIKFDPNDYREISLTGVTPTSFVVGTLPTDSDATRIEVVLSGTNGAYVDFSDWIPEDAYVGNSATIKEAVKIQYSVIARSEDPYLWQAGSLIVKPYFLNLEPLQLRYDFHKYNRGRVYL